MAKGQTKKKIQITKHGLYINKALRGLDNRTWVAKLRAKLTKELQGLISEQTAVTQLLIQRITFKAAMKAVSQK